MINIDNIINVYHECQGFILCPWKIYPNASKLCTNG
jgi:hypothetical protein